MNRRAPRDLPATMRAAVLDRYGAAGSIAIREVSVPRLAAHDVLIRIDTAGVGSWDVSMRKGDVETEHGFPLIMGTDGSGVVATVADEFMSITVLIGLLVLAIVIVAAAGVWRARGQGPAGVQASLMMLAVTVAAALVVYFLIKRRV